MASKKPSQDERNTSDDLTLASVEVDTDLDPHLQDVLIAAQDNIELGTQSAMSLSDEGTMIVDIIAKLNDPAVPVSGLNVVRTMGKIVTGTVRVEDIESVRKDPNVSSLKRATQLHKDLQFSVPEIEASQQQLVEGLQDSTIHDGRGVIIGVVDYDCDFVHRNFRNADGTTRLKFLWDQRGGSTSISPQGYGYGRELDENLINQALSPVTSVASQSAYQTLFYEPKKDAHGTHVLDIAAGNGTATGNRGVAPGADLIFVHLAAGDYEADESFGNSRRLLEAVDYIFEKASALGRPAVVNLSLGTHGGPHDGSTLVEQGFDALLETSGRAIVISAGNSRNRHSHASGQISRAVPRMLSWEIATGDQTDNEMEVWYLGGQALSVTLVAPSGTRLGPVALGKTQVITRQGVTVGRIIHRKSDPNNGDNQVDILLDRSLSAGVWQVEFRTESAAPVSFHAWIERDDFGQSRFAEQDSDPTHTVGSISCGGQTIVVGSYNATVPARDMAPSSGEGPTRDGKLKPEVSAPGVGINAARSLTQGTTRMSGTSMAAPHVTGLVALLMQTTGPRVGIEDIRRLVMSTARRSVAAPALWHARYGEGRITALAALLAHLAPAAAKPASQTGTLPVITAPVAPVGVPAATPERGPAGVDSTTLSSLLNVLTHAAISGPSRVRIEIEIEPVQT